MSQVIKTITRKPLWVNALIILGIIILVLILFFISLSFITRHNKVIKVPSVLGKNINEATNFLESNGFSVEVSDSVYIDSAAKLSVIKQSPDPDALVKTNRTVYLTINRAVPPLIEMPDLRGFSYKSAELYLQTMGLKVGDTIHKPDFTRNILDQTLNGQPIRQGTKINMGSVIGLVVGDGIGSVQMDVPELVGMTLGQAKSYLQSMNINIGAVVADPDVAKQEDAYIYKQSPSKYDEPIPGQRVQNKIRPGQVIDIWLSTTAPAPPVRDTSGAQPATPPNQ
ncbi:MAG: hypothetical protein JWN76_648 [Chitinophagaceae bacterium]|nr:hypothetical protein [Chitinophagaceae bacterium]